MTKTKRQLAWRCKTLQQQKDKASIYNSREWAELRAAWIKANPLCELCKAEGIIHAVEAVHHRHPIEDSDSLEEMRRWAFDWNNLQSLCRHHHHEVHKQSKSHSSEAVQLRARQRNDRWLSQIRGAATDTDRPPTETPGGSF